MPETTILVILYNKDFSDSETVNALIKSNAIKNSRVVIWNNGPSSLNEDKGRHMFERNCQSFIFKETIANISLASIYNWVIRHFNSERYILLDHDSSITEYYLKEALNVPASCVGMPLIFKDNEIVNPCNHATPVSGLRLIEKEDYITTIGSGLVLGKNVIKRILQRHSTVFDERFYLYGVDTTFCYRLHDLNLFESILIINGFEHSLSRLETEDSKTLRFRQIERSKDLALRVRYYCSLQEKLKEIAMLFGSYFKKSLFKKQQQYKLGIFVKTFMKGYYEKQ